MTPRLAAVLVLAAACATPSAAQEREPLFRSKVDIVVVPVAVMRGRTAVTGIAERDFVLTDNGVKQTVTLQQTTVAIDLTIVLCGFQPGRSSEFILGLLDARSIVSGLRADDRMRIIECGASVREAVPMSRLGSVQPLGRPDGSVAPDLPTPYRGVSVTVNNSLVDALFMAIAWPSEVFRRHLVVVFSDGFDPWTSTLDPAVLPRLAARSDAVIHAVMSTSPSTLSSAERARLSRANLDRWSLSYGALGDAVTLTGGEVRFSTGHLDELRDVLELFRSSYLLGYEPTAVGRGGWHEIAVEVLRERVHVIARRGYFDVR
jgi:hypothetical protein